MRGDQVSGARLHAPRRKVEWPWRYLGHRRSAYERSTQDKPGAAMARVRPQSRIKQLAIEPTLGATGNLSRAEQQHALATRRAP